MIGLAQPTGPVRLDKWAQQIGAPVLLKRNPMRLDLYNVETTDFRFLEAFRSAADAETELRRVGYERFGSTNEWRKVVVEGGEQ